VGIPGAIYRPPPGFFGASGWISVRPDGTFLISAAKRGRTDARNIGWLHGCPFMAQIFDVPQ